MIRTRSPRTAWAALAVALAAVACSTAAPEPAEPAPEPVAAAPAAPAAPPPASPTPAPPAPDPLPPVNLARFGAGDGPSAAGGTVRLLDAARSKGQSNAVAFDREAEGAREWVVVRGSMRVLEGGEGGAFVLLGTAEHGVRGPAPFVPEWSAPNLKGAFAVGIDVHEPRSEEPFGPWGNVLGMPERLVSIHWDGREIAKRVAATEFRGEFREIEIALRHVCGGAEVTVRIGREDVFDREFVADLHPYEARLAVGAGTRDGATTEFDVRDLRVEAGPPAAPRRAPVRVEVFHHVRTDNSKTAFETEAELPPAGWAFGRVVMTLEIHDAGLAWDEWDRNGEVSVWDRSGTKLGIVPFITSYRTPCAWKVDVTHFRPLLAGKVRFEVAAGTNFYKNRGYQMSVSLDFHHGTPDLEPFRVVPVWVGIAHHRGAENHFRDFFAPVAVPIDAATKAARLFTTTTGHSQVGEFTPSDRTVTFRADRDDAASAGVRFENRLWKDDCWLNANRPQFGTWKYPRAGWAPGDVVRPWRIDLTPHVRPGRTAELSYEPKPYDFSGEEKRPSDADVAQAIHVVRSYLVLYRAPDGLTPAPSVRILEVVPEGNAAKAGIRAGDWLATYDGRNVATAGALRAAVDAAQAAGAKSVKVVVVRGTERLEFDLPPGRLGVSLSAQ